MNYRYVKVPFRMIPQAYLTGGLEKLVLYSIYSEALELPFDVENVSKRILYLYLIVEENKHLCKIPQRIVKVLQEMDSITEYIELNDPYSEYRGFNPDIDPNVPNGVFNPLDAEDNSVIERLDSYFAKDEALWEDATMFYRVYSMLNLLRLHTNYTFEQFQSVFNEFCIKERGCKTTDWSKGHAGFNLSIAIELFHDEIRLAIKYPPAKYDSKEYQKEYKDLMERKVMLAADMAMKSIMGKKSIGNATKSEILARMAGKRNISDGVDVDDPELNPECLEVVKRYSCKDNFRRIMGLMRGSFFKYIEVVKGSEASGYFFSNSRDLSRKELEQGIAKIIAENKKKNGRYRIQRFRAKLKKNTFKMVGVTPAMPEPTQSGNAATNGMNQVTQTQIPFPPMQSQPFPPMQPQQQAPMQGGYQQQPTQFPQGEMPFPPPQGYVQQPYQQTQVFGSCQQPNGNDNTPHGNGKWQ